MPIDWSPFVELVRRHRRFLLTTHIRPDGDALGSMLGLAHALERLGKQTRTVVASTTPPRYHFLDPERKVDHFKLPGDAYRDAEAVVVLDTGAWGQLADFGTFLRTLDCPKAVIDHHQTQDDLGAVRFVDIAAEACGRLVYDAVRALGVEPDERLATLLYVALAMDTGWFRHSNTTAASFTLASKLTAAGARPEKLYDVLFEQNSLARQKLKGVVLGRLQTSDGGLLAWSELRLPDYEATGATPQDSEDLVNETRSVSGVEVGLFFMEQPRGGVKVSFRARSRVDVARLAEQFGGGGHRLASGATLMTNMEDAKMRVLAAARTALSAAG
jgi:bifunctional oligoribonuclease and PAP phosphatase NrnA